MTDDNLALKVGIKIWHNESSGKVSGLTSWGEGESFASLGIGHFIWYPQHVTPLYGESFSDLLHYLAGQGVNLPRWLRGRSAHFCPWVDRHSFIKASSSRKMETLRQLLVETIPLQAKYMVLRLEQALPDILQEVPIEDRAWIRQVFNNIMGDPKGIFALIDYVNFKGAGLGHNGRDWGLLHVLRQMRKAPGDLSTLEALVWSADVVLTRRVNSGLSSSNEARWLLGWRKRIYGYL